MLGRGKHARPGTGEPPRPVDSTKVIGLRVVTLFAKAEADDKAEASQANPRAVVTGVAARLREITKLRDEGQLTHEEYAELKKRLLGR